MTDITKEEIHAYTDATNKTATALEKIADRLENITAQGAECGEKMNLILERCKEAVETIVELEVRSKKIRGDIIWVKWLWTVLAAVVALGIVITELTQKVQL